MDTLQLVDYLEEVSILFVVHCPPERVSMKAIQEDWHLLRVVVQEFGAVESRVEVHCLIVEVFVSC